MLFRPTTYQAN